MTMQRPVFWHDGMFLKPQHFQLQDEAVRARLVPFGRFLQPHLWGVGDLEIDRGALANGSFDVRRGSFLFPDGTYAEYPGNALIQPRRFEAVLSEGKPLQVYLGLKRWDDAGKNVTVIDTADDMAEVATRLVTLSSPDLVADLHAGEGETPVRQLHYLLRILWEGEMDRAGGYLLIPLARLERFGAVRLSGRFIPPCLSINAVEPLSRLVREIRDQLAARTRDLERYKRQRGMQSASFGSRDLVYVLALRTLNRHLPQLFHLEEAGSVHPWAVYGALRQLAGELSTFSLRVNALGEVDDETRLLPPYDHERLWNCFVAVQDLVLQLLAEITAGPDYIIPLVRDDECFSADLKPSLLETGIRYFLALRTAEDPQGVLDSFDAVVKLCAREHLPLLASRALPGLPVEFLRNPPQELPRRADTLYFAVDHRDKLWDVVAKEHNLALKWDHAPDDLEVELLVLAQREGGAACI